MNKASVKTFRVKLESLMYKSATEVEIYGSDYEKKLILILYIVYLIL